MPTPDEASRNERDTLGAVVTTERTGRGISVHLRVNRLEGSESAKAIRARLALERFDALPEAARLLLTSEQAEAFLASMRDAVTDSEVWRLQAAEPATLERWEKGVGYATNLVDAALRAALNMPLAARRSRAGSRIGPVRGSMAISQEVCDYAFAQGWATGRDGETAPKSRGRRIPRVRVGSGRTVTRSLPDSLRRRTGNPERVSEHLPVIMMY